MAASFHLDSRNRKVGLLALAFALAMVGVGYAAVPLYRLFCQATGFAGAPRRASEAEARHVTATSDTMSIRFDANVEHGLPWQFRPEQVTQQVSLGGRRMAVYLAENTSNRVITGRASYNIEPEQAAKYFNKIQCFCFTEQTLEPHKQVRMPVVFYVDPKIKDDPDARDVEQITLSYTFHRIGQAAAAPPTVGGTQGL